MITTVDEKGSVALPQQILSESDVHPGDDVEVTADDGRIILRKVGDDSGESLLEILRGLKGLPIPDRQRSPVRDMQL